MKIAIVCSYTPSLLLFRGDLIAMLISKGCEVVCHGPPGDDTAEEQLRRMGAKFVGIPLRRASLSPVQDLRYLRNLRGHFVRERPDVVFCYTAKPVIFGSFAARLARVPRIISLVTGLGINFVRQDLRTRTVRMVQKCLYRTALAASNLVIFQNSDDLESFVQWRLVARKKARIVAGSGINLERFPFAPLPSSQNGFVFLMVGRLLREKGVGEFLEAATQVDRKFPDRCRFFLAGGEDENPGSFRISELKNGEHPVELLGARDDIASLLTACHCFVLPSYREGTPRSTLEALSVGRPVITTDAVGCRETVRPGENGWLVPVEDATALAEAMGKAVSLPTEGLAAMGRASRRLAETVFDVRKVNENMAKWILDS